MAAISSPVTLSGLTLSLCLIASLQYFAVDVNAAVSAEQYAKIQKFCSYGRVPDDCEKCISSDDRAAMADYKGLAVIAVNCTAVPMGLFLEHLHGIQEQPYKETAENCTLPLDQNAGGFFVMIDGKIEGNNYYGAQSDAQKIRSWLKHCDYLFAMRGGEQLWHALDLLIDVIRPCDNLVGIFGMLASEGGKLA